MKDVIITGSTGVIGTVLTTAIPHRVTCFDLPKSDARDYQQLLSSMRGHDVAIHLAWNTTIDNDHTELLAPENILMTFNVYRAAVEAGVQRVVMASSVHADKFVDRKLSGLLLPYSLPLPDSPYGAGKCMMESLGRHYADSKNLEVVCVRFGGVNVNNLPPQEPKSERQVWLSHSDCVRLINCCIEASEIPNNYSAFYGVSHNRDRLHDYSNPVGWQPLDGAD